LVTSFYNGGGGAIGALIASSIDSSRQSSATEKAQPIIKELDDYNFKNVFFISNVFSSLEFFMNFFKFVAFGYRLTLALIIKFPALRA
jgi:hypothetical protein